MVSTDAFLLKLPRFLIMFDLKDVLLALLLNQISETYTD